MPWLKFSMRSTSRTLSASPTGSGPGGDGVDALDALADGIGSKAVNWILDADIRGFPRVKPNGRCFAHQPRLDDAVCRAPCWRPARVALIRGWLKAGVVEDGVRQPATKGTPQGAVISPLLANIYLHYAYDLWTTQWRKRHARGAMIVVRYADDTVVGFEHRSDAELFLAQLRIRMAEFALELHPGVNLPDRVRPPSRIRQGGAGDGKPETFDSWALPTSARARGRAASSLPGTRGANGNRRNLGSPGNFDDDGTKPWQNRARG